jgi:hypothetical protein
MTLKQQTQKKISEKRNSLTEQQLLKIATQINDDNNENPKSYKTFQEHQMKLFCNNSKTSIIFTATTTILAESQTLGHFKASI